MKISESTLRRRHARVGLVRRNRKYDINSARNKLVSLLDGPDCTSGYRGVWHHLQLQGSDISRNAVETLILELDQEGKEAIGNVPWKYITVSWNYILSTQGISNCAVET